MRFINGLIIFDSRSKVFKFSGKDEFSISSFCNKMSQRSLLAFGVSQKRSADSESEKTVSSDQPAQKKCKTNSGSGSASNSCVFQPQWLEQFDWLEYDAETKRLFCRT